MKRQRDEETETESKTHRKARWVRARCPTEAKYQQQSQHLACVHIPTSSHRASSREQIRDSCKRRNEVCWCLCLCVRLTVCLLVCLVLGKEQNKSGQWHTCSGERYGQEMVKVGSCSSGYCGGREKESCMGGRCSTTITAAPSPKSFGFRSVRSWCVVCCICVCCLHQGSATPGRKRETVQMLRQYTHTRTHRKTKHAPLEGQPGVRESQHDQSQDSRAAHPVRLSFPLPPVFTRSRKESTQHKARV